MKGFSATLPRRKSRGVAAMWADIVTFIDESRVFISGAGLFLGGLVAAILG